MALQQNVTLAAFGNQLVEGAYISVDSCRLSKVVIDENGPVWMTMTTMRVDFSAASKQAGSAPLGTFAAEFPHVEGTDPVDATYTYLKSLPEFANAVDV